jgi:hypothetical protein
MAMIRPKGLGRGLDALARRLRRATRRRDALQSLPIERIAPASISRARGMDDASLEELAQSIREQGIMAADSRCAPSTAPASRSSPASALARGAARRLKECRR